ncbi:permease prefix domain 1-containing protein [Deinococcus koreensis]|uniref:Uncharacterized protein n=1 Tax=Deinococcus koreensis TaxID=2054903 RepID=A0A2K3UVL4_9DEIO|nr:permease prefix domain 1-containing protein [Deinococcus koreensis]PNY80585.1 hypothetical protein CVO96_03695 [Deinococcus koreensis]
MNVNDTERYLNAATRGLWGRQRRELSTELRGHIQMRVNELLIAGHGEAQAQAQVLRELGAPAQVSGGMLQVHTLPGALKGGFAAILVATAMLSVLPHSQAQVQSIYGNIPNYGASGYFNFQQLQEELKRAGAGLTGNAANATLTLPGAPRPDYPVNTWGATTLKQDGQTYIQARSIIAALQNTGAVLKLSGWTNPILQAQGARIRFQTSDWRVLNDLYGQTLGGNTDLTAFGSLPLTMLEPDGNTSEISVSNPRLQKGQIYALVTAQFSDWKRMDSAGNPLDSGTIMLASNIVQGAAGMAQFRIYNDTRPLQLFGTVEAFQKAIDPYRGKTRPWNAARPAPALLLELSGRFDQDAFKVVLPDKTRLN